MKLLMSISSLFLLLINTSFAQDSMTVDQAVQRVLQIHPAIEQALANTRAAEARVSQASSETSGCGNRSRLRTHRSCACV